MKTLHRYVLNEITRFFLISLLVFTGILVIARMLKLTSLVINKGVGVEDVLMIFLSIVPTFLEVALPVSVLLGVMLAFGRFSADSEIVVIRASGIALKQLIYPVLLFSIMAGVGNLIVSMYLRPWGHSTLSEHLFRVASTRSTAGLSPGMFNDLGPLTLYAEKIEHLSGYLQNVLIDDRRNGTNRQVIVAKSGTILSDQERQTINFLLRDGSIHVNGEGGSYNLTRFEHNTLVLNPEELNQNERRSGPRPREMYLSELQTEKTLYTEKLRAAPELSPAPVIEPASKLKAESPYEQLRHLRSVEIEIVRKLSMPFACVVMALLAMPLGIQPSRSNNSLGATLSVVIAMSVVVVYYMLLSLGLTFAQDGSLSAPLGLWGPNIVFLIVAFFALRKMGSERWITVVHVVDELLQRLSVRLGLMRKA